MLKTSFYFWEQCYSISLDLIYYNVIDFIDIFKILRDTYTQVCVRAYGKKTCNKKVIPMA